MYSLTLYTFKCLLYRCLRQPSHKHTLKPRVLRRLRRRLRREQGEGGVEENLQFTQSAEQQQVATFVDEGTKPESTLVDEKLLPSTFSSAVDAKKHTILDFLRRPYVVHNGVWDSSQIAATELFSILFPDTFFNLTPVKEKIAGFKFVRGSVVLKIQVNAQPFQQGRLLLVFNPATDLSDIRFLSRTSLTGFPHVDLDLSVSSTMSLKVPLIAPFSHWDLASNMVDRRSGLLQAFVYGPLASAAATSADYTVWMHLEDVEVEVPMGGVTADPPEPRLEQGGKEQIPQGTVTQVAKAAGTMAKAVSGLPVIGAAASTAGWVADAIGGVASMFGWSKPTNIDNVQLFKQNPFQNMATCDGKDNNAPLTLDSRYGLTSFEGIFGSKVDEMSLDYLTSIPSFLFDFGFATASAVGTTLANIPVHPTWCPSAPQIVQVDNAVWPTTLGFVSSAFTQWRGSLKYVFKFVKTQYHSGRIRVTYNPASNPNLAEVDLNKCYSQIFDLRSKSEFEFEVPFVGNVPWRLIRQTYGDTAFNRNKIELEPHLNNGYIFVTVLNKLVAPTVVSNAITCLVEVSGGADFTLAIPHATVDVPATSVDPPTPPKSYSGMRTEQGFWDIGTREESIVEDGIPLFTAPTRSQQNGEELCVGEKITSLRQLMKRFQYAKSTALCTATEKYLYANPYYRSPPGNTVQSYSHDYFSFFYNMFSFHRGAMRLKLVPQKTAIQNITATLIPAVVSTSSLTSFQSGLTYDQYNTNGYAKSVHPLMLTGGVEVEVPYYQNRMMSRHFDNFDAPSYPVGNHNTCVMFTQGGGYDANKIVTVDIYRSVGDDFSFGFAIGVPPLLCSLPLVPPDTPLPENASS